jgi:hypothetical protein
MQYTGRVVEELNQRNAEEDLRRTNWVSVSAAVQRCILDFNDALAKRVSQKMAEAFDPLWPAKHKPH